MATLSLGRTLVIANPASRSGRGAQGARTVERALSSGSFDLADFTVRPTAGPGDAVEVAGSAAGFDTVVALGGDGVIHEVANGLMRVAEDARPRLAVVPLGSGNDFARTLGMPRNDPEAALRSIASGTAVRFDLGLVNGAYFVQTLSFGLDAAIALDTVERRVRTGARGARLFAASGFDVFARRHEPYPYRASLRGGGHPGGEAEISGEEVVFAVQVGPTYGGGFRICPKASPTDGLLDLCRSVRTPSVPRALALFSLARFGLHAGSPIVEFARFRRLAVDFDREPPCQVDGEKLVGTRFEISCVPAALEVVTACRRRGGRRP